MSQVRHGKEINFAAINVATDATTEVIAAVTGRKIVVVGIVLSADIAGTATLVHTTATPVAISGVMTLGASPVTIGNFSEPLTETGSGKNFGITAATCTVDGLVAYYLD